MKKFFTLLVLAACCAAMTWGCSDDKYDDTEIRQEIENLKQEIASMSVLSRPMPRLNYEIFLDIRPKWGKRNKKQ